MDQENEPSPAPVFIYKILPSAPPTPLPTEFPLSDLDRTDGFIHLSLASQLPRTLSRFFADSEEVSLLRIAYGTVKMDIKWEVIKNGEIFPHLYRSMGGGDVESWRTIRREEKDWPTVLEAEKEWLR